MLILRDSTPLPSTLRDCVVAIGNFDGMHLGHRAVIEKTLSLARRDNIPAVVLTFEPHPRRVFRPELPAMRLVKFAEKARQLEAAGIDAMRVIRFTRGFSTTTAEHFVDRVLHKELGASHVVTGEDFIFGFNREGDAAYLARRASELGFAASACPPVLLDGIRCSSTHIRECLVQGRTPEASRFLGRPYTISGRVRGGDKRGRTLGFPTANILPGRIFTPANGVYAVRAKLREEWRDGVASLGTRPMFDNGHILLEVHLFDWQEEIYGEQMEVALVKQLREERRFDTVEALQDQMAQDCDAARKTLVQTPSF